MTSAQPFSERVAQVHAIWTERRELKTLHARHDLASQLCLLDYLGRWMREAAQTVRSVYGASFPIAVESEGEGTPAAAFTMNVGGIGRLHCCVVERPLLHGTHYRVDVRARTPRGAWRALGPERRLGYWCRPMIEDAVLETIAAYERSIDEIGVPRVASGNALEIFVK